MLNTSLIMRRVRKRVYSPAYLFAAGEQGVWYDPSDLSTMFQDTAGLTPVTAVEQPVGLILDKSGRGNNASQATSGSRPTLSARVNQFVQTEDFSTVSWTTSSATATVDTITATGAFGGIYQSFTKIGAGIQYRLVAELSPGNVSAGRLTISEAAIGAAGVGCDFTLTGNGTAGTPAAYGINWTVGTAQIEALVDGWYRCTLTATSSGSTGYAGIIGHTGSAVATNTIKARKPDLRVTNDGVGLPTYQRVNTSTDYDTSGFPLYLRFDGTNDWMETSSIDFSATDKMSVFAGVRKLAASIGMIAETSNAFDTSSGVFSFAGEVISADYTSSVRGSISPSINGRVGTTYTVPITNVVSIAYDMAQVVANDKNKMRVNAATPTLTNTGPNGGTGAFGNHPLYIGRRAGTSLSFNGRIYHLIVRGAQSTNAQVFNTETWVNRKTGAY